MYIELGHAFVNDLPQDIEQMSLLQSSLDASITHLGSKTTVHNGPSIVALWSALRPETARTFSRLESIIELEQLADNFDAYAWTFKAPSEQLVQLRKTIRAALEDAKLYDSGSGLREVRSS